MEKKKILFITSSIGLGHLTRDLAIVSAIRNVNAGIDILWLAYKTLIPLLKQEGEEILPEAELLTDGNPAAESAARPGFQLNLSNYVGMAKDGWIANAGVFKQIADKYDFDLIIGDEAYELVIALIHGKISIKPTFLSIYDFLGLEPMNRNPWEWLKCNLIIRNFVKTVPEKLVTYAFIGEEEDVIDSPWGLFLPNRRQWARENCHFVGFVTRFDPGQLPDSSELRRELNYGDETLVICSIGGTSVGAELLSLCGQAYPMVRAHIPNLRMVLVCGPRLDPGTLNIPEGPEVIGYVPDLYKHFSACDLAVVQAGGTTTLELTALQKPFLHFPLEQHYEQQIYVTERLERHRAGIKMRFPDTSPEILAERIVSNIGKKVDYASPPFNGAENIAKMVNRLLS